MIIGVMYIKYDNICYLEANIQQQQAISYFTNLLSSIYNTDGYKADTAVCYINEYDKRIGPYHKLNLYDNVVTNPYTVGDYLENNYNWTTYFYKWCNYQPERVIAADDLTDEEKKMVEIMPRYPDDGSIRVIDNILIIKF